MNALKHGHTNFVMASPFISRIEQDFDGENCRHFSAPGYMDLVVEYVGTHYILGLPLFSFGHYGRQNGDVMCDPEMWLAVDFKNERIYPTSFRNDYVGLYQEVYEIIGDERCAHAKLRRDLDDFLHDWLKNLQAQGHK